MMAMLIMAIKYACQLDASYATNCGKATRNKERDRERGRHRKRRGKDRNFLCLVEAQNKSLSSLPKTFADSPGQAIVAECANCGSQTHRNCYNNKYFTY